MVWPCLLLDLRPAHSNAKTGSTGLITVPRAQTCGNGEQRLGSPILDWWNPDNSRLCSSSRTSSTSKACWRCNYYLSSPLSNDFHDFTICTQDQLIDSEDGVGSSIFRCCTRFQGVQGWQADVACKLGMSIASFSSFGFCESICGQFGVMGLRGINDLQPFPSFYAEGANYYVFLPTFSENQELFANNNPSQWCTVYAITVIFFRVIGRYIRTEKFYREDIIMLVAIFPLILRQALLHVVLLFGTNNTITDGLSASGISRRETGSKLVLATRILYVTYLWAIKLSTSTFLHNLTMSTASSHGKNQKILKWFYFFLFVTYVGTIVSVLGTCRPFSGYWQVIPDPGPQCRSGHEFLVTMGLSNGISNLALVLFPLPVIFASRLSGWQ